MYCWNSFRDSPPKWRSLWELVIKRMYSWLSLSQTRLSRITTYLEVKILSLPKHENLTKIKKYCGKEEKLLLRSNFSSFPQYFRYMSNIKSPNTYKFVKCGCSTYFFLNSENLICRGTNISKCFRESLGIRDTRVDCICHDVCWDRWSIGIPCFHQLCNPSFRKYCWNSFRDSLPTGILCKSQ